uniref:Ankyrin repeat protein n=1 Tax=Marseillevirus LCMAC201 TaxID=2506605 RepID=A0A481YXB3_9VIRU|nr:MAG: ankyrin repeat protein [Marseillevirus LCMAC201]
MNIELAITDLTTFPTEDLVTMAKYYNLPLAPTKYQLARSIATQLYAAPVRSHKIGNMPNEDLIKAVKSNNLELVEKLLVEGANVDIQNTRGETALMLAAHSGHAPIVELLLNKNAKVDIKDTGGITALMYAANNGHAPIVKLLLNKNAQVDIKDTNKMTALMYAANNRNTLIVKLLLNKNAQVDIKDTNKMTALMYAAQSGNTRIVKLLLNKNAQVDIQNTSGWTALDLAKQYNYTNIIKLLKPKLPFNPQWYQTCSEDLDIITQESWTDLAKEQEPDDPVTIRFPADPGIPERVECGARENFIQMWKTAPIMVPWIPNPKTVEHRLLSGEPLVDDSGYGAIPASGPKFWKITQYHYVMNPELLEEGDSNYIAEKLVNEKIRYGKKKGTFGESEAHGQHSTYIYKLKVVK